MKTFVVVILLLALAVMAGWLTYSRSGDSASITIEGKEIREDTRHAIDAGKDAVEKTKDAVREKKIAPSAP